MAKKENKTNAMRILDRKGIPYRTRTYECEEFIDGVHVADLNGDPYERSFKTLVTEGRSGAHYVFVIPVDREIDFKKAAAFVGEKSVAMVPVKNILALTGYIRGGCTPLGMKKAFPTVIQDSARAQEEIIISGGRIGLQILLRPDDLASATGAQFGDVVAG